MNRDEKVAWASALRPGSVVNYDGRIIVVRQTIPIFSLSKNGTRLYACWLYPTLLVDELIDSRLEKKYEHRVFDALLILRLRKLIDVEVHLEGQMICSAVHDLNPVL